MDSINKKASLWVLVFILEGVHVPREETKKIGILARMDVKGTKPKLYAILIKSICLIVIKSKKKSLKILSKIQKKKKRF